MIHEKYKKYNFFYFRKFSRGITKLGKSYYKMGLLLEKIRIIILLQNEAWYKTGQLFYYKTGQALLQNGAAFEFYYKTGQRLLQNGAAFEVYYITGQLLQNGPLQTHVFFGSRQAYQRIKKWDFGPRYIWMSAKSEGGGGLDLSRTCLLTGPKIFCRRSLIS